MKDHIIHFLKQSPGYLSGEDISRQLKISRAGIWKNIEELRKEGYEILAVPHLGYKINTIPDKLIPREVADGLKTKILGREYIHFEKIPSTMDHAFQLGVEGEKEGTLVCAEAQTLGRGRMAREWNSPKGKGIYMSLILRPSLSPADVAKMTLFAAVAVCEALIQTSGLNVTIKWPNDLLVNGKKVGGILTEMSAEMDRVRFIVIGVGINVNTTRKSIPEQATSLRLEVHKAVSRTQMLQTVLFSLEQWYTRLNKSGFDPILSRWRELSTTLGKTVSVGKVTGTAIDLDEHGGLIIQSASGQKTRCMSGDVNQL